MSHCTPWASSLPQNYPGAPVLPRRHRLTQAGSTSVRVPSSSCRTRALRIALAVLAALCALALTLSAASAQSAEPTIALDRHIPIQIADGTAVRVGHYDPTRKLRLTLSIKPPHLAEEEEFLRQLTDRHSPLFHQFLTPEEWNARFAPSEQDEQAVVDWAQSQGLTITHRFNHRLLVDVEGTAGTIEKAFGVTINQYNYRDEVTFSNDRDPLIPARLQGILYNIQGLNNIQRDHGSRPGPQSKAADYAEGPAYSEGPRGHGDAHAPPPNLAPRPNADTQSNDVSNSTLFTNNYVNPTEIYSSQVYNYDGLQNLGHCCNPHNDAGGAPNVSNIAIAAFGNYNNNDILGFMNAYPYLAYNYSTWYIDGNIDCTSDPNDCPSGETTQDLEWTVATSNSFSSYLNTAQVIVYIGANYNNSTFTDLYGYMLSDNSARVFTTSWSCTEEYGCSDSTMDSRHSIFNNMLGQGWTLIAASGDRGSSDDCYLNKNTDTYNTAHEAAAYPGSDFDVLAAGGTKLQVYGDGTWDYEHAWEGGTSFGSCGGNNGGSGGGVSVHYDKPGFQSYSTWNAYSKRQTPDISLNALGVGQNMYINGNLQCCANGTSIVAPELAGFFAQENAYLNYIGHICGANGNASCTPVGNPMPFFYPAAYYNDASHFPFYDMTGNYCNSNDVTAAQNLGFYCTGAGWDYVTGWGSANMLQLAWAINWYLIPASGTPGINWTGGPATGHWYSTDQQISWTITDYGGGTFPGTGIAGFTQGWDALTPDSSSKPHGGTNDSFYWGPEYPNFNDGCMTLVGNATCPGGVSQGCHTAHVRGWNNQGWTTGDQTYGPVCYDTVAPTVKVATSGTAPTNDGWFTSSALVTITASDPGATDSPATGSGVKTIYYAIDTGSCYPGNLGPCSVYSAPFTISAGGSHYVYYFAVDKAGNYSSEPFVWVNIDTATPKTLVNLNATGPVNGWYTSPVGVTFNATDTNGPGVATTWWNDNNSNCVPILAQVSTYCNAYGGSSFLITHNGLNALYYFSEDSSNILEPLNYVYFWIDDTPPQTSALIDGKRKGTGYTGPVTVSLRATDNASGVANTVYYLNGNGPVRYTRPITVSYRGAVTINFFSTDWAGNQEPIKSVNFLDF